MKKLIAVIGASYGDCGKGLMTDYFADQLKTGFVLRHNSSAQAGHTVQLEDGTRHVFSHFGSGTFVGLPTVLGHKFVVNPLIFRKEREELIAKGYDTKVYVHGNCMITTPYDMLINQMVEHSRDDKRHGSCGIGFNETINRHYNHLELTTHINRDLVTWDNFVNKVIDVRSQLIQHRISDINLEHLVVNDLHNVYHTEEVINDYFDACKYFLDHVEIYHNYEFLKYDNVIFEGAQGLQLDQSSINFPYVTRCNTGIKDIIEILDQIDNDRALEVVYISRCYVTKHGAGNLPHEEPFPEHLDGLDKTNQPNEFQGSLRYAPLNLDTFYSVTMNDMLNARHTKYLVIAKTAFTWLDQKPTDLILGNMKVQIPFEDYVGFLENAINYGSYGPTRQHVKQLK